MVWAFQTCPVVWSTTRMSLGQTYLAAVEFSEPAEDFDVAAKASESFGWVAAVLVVDFEGFLPRFDVVAGALGTCCFDAVVDFIVVHIVLQCACNINKKPRLTISRGL